MELRLDGKVAVVCGGTQGIGRAAAEELARQGASIVLVARNEESLRSVASSLSTSSHQKHAYIVADFSDSQGLSSALQRGADLLARTSILVANFGGPPGGPLHEARPGDLQAAFGLHVIASQILLASVLEPMKRQGYGRIINVISTSVKQPIQGLGVSNTIRGAVANWSKTLAGELGPFGITVNNVLPGATNTGRLRGLISAKAGRTGRVEDELIEEMRREVPVGRIAEPAEIANAIAFLASPAASYVNGINLPVDGGRTASL